MRSRSIVGGPILAAWSTARQSASSSATQVEIARRARLGIEMGRGLSAVPPGGGHARASSRRVDAVASARRSVTIRKGFPCVSK